MENNSMVASLGKQQTPHAPLWKKGGHKNLPIKLKGLPLVRMQGRLLDCAGVVLRGTAPGAKVGDLAMIHRKHHAPLPAEVVGFQDKVVLLAPLGEAIGLQPGLPVIPTGHPPVLKASEAMLGRVLDGLGQPMDGGPPLPDGELIQIRNDAPNAMSRRPIGDPIDTGVKALDAFLTCAEGQRLGIFAAAGGGKSTLMSMILKNIDVDVIVTALIGERGREVGEFLEQALGERMRAKSVVVCATSDRPAAERVAAANTATAAAEWFRDQGKKVLLVMDSVTRFARAMREIGLAAGEPPGRRGFPPSVFAALPRLVERAGMNEHGSITAFYTVLVEGDDMNEPVADEVRSLLDGHIILSSTLAAEGQRPAVDVLKSVSRLMDQIVPKHHLDLTRRIRALMSRYLENQFLIRIGEYRPGSDAELDEAVRLMPLLKTFLSQHPQDPVEKGNVVSTLERIMRS